MREFSLPFKKKGLSASTINKTIIAGKVALTWAFQEGDIHTNPAEGLKNFVGKPKERGISKEERMSRNIVFHSWRHRYAAKMADLVDARSLGLATGHKTQAMLEHYAAHANETHFQAVMYATRMAFNGS